MSIFLALKTYLSSFFFPHAQRPSPTRTPTPKCIHPLDNSTSSTLTLPDGRKLGYAEYGSPTGWPIFYLHGLPGARLEGARHEDLGRELGARIIAIDRPGIGWSSPQKKRRLLDFVQDVRCLAEYLGVERYSVWGISGGGPYALACAYGLPAANLHSISIVCGLGPPDIGMKGANWLHYVGFTWGYRWIPVWLGQFYWKWQVIGRLDLSDEERLHRVLHPGPFLQNAAQNKDNQDVLDHPDIVRLSLRAGREAFAQGYGAVYEDGQVMCRDWGFRIEDVREDLKVQLWYGRRDSFIPLNHGLQIAARLGGRAQLRVEDEGHAGIAINWNREILEAIVGSRG